MDRLSHATKYVYNICTTPAQRLQRWSNILQILYNFLCLLGERGTGSGGWKFETQISILETMQNLNCGITVILYLNLSRLPKSKLWNRRHSLFEP